LSESHLSGSGPCHCNVTIRRRGLDVVVALDGELDLATAPAVARALRDLIEDQGHLDVVLDLGAVSFIDSIGIRTILDARRSLCVRNGRFTIVDPSAAVRRVLRILGLNVQLEALAFADN
jgi:anti-sigma B factor antagonist